MKSSAGGGGGGPFHDKQVNSWVVFAAKVCVINNCVPVVVDGVSVVVKLDVSVGRQCHTDRRNVNLFFGRNIQ